MDPLLDQLIARGALDASGASWAVSHQSEHGGALSAVLLELDLVDEEDLIEGLMRCARLPYASAEDLASLSTELAGRFPESFSRAFDLCPLRLESPELAVLVSGPLSPESREELRELFHLELRELLCHGHTLALARARVYGREPDERTRELEARLARRRRDGRLSDVLTRLASVTSFSAAAGDLLRFANALLDFAVLFRVDGDELRVAGGGSGHRVPTAVAVPDAGCTLAAALRHGSYFLGPLAGTPADLAFFASLERSVPRSAFVAPIPTTGARSVVLYADNGPRGVAPRWLAELTVAVARLGQLGSAPARAVTVVSEPEVELLRAEEAAEQPQPEHGPDVSPVHDAQGRASSSAAAAEAGASSAQIEASERAILERLRAAAQGAGMELGAFVDVLLRERSAPAPPAAPAPQAALADPTTALMGEVRGLFERLATDIPTQMALGMQNAFRDIVPRLAAAPPASAPPGRAAAASPPSAAAAAVELVVTEAKPREVPSYRSRRAKTTKVKL